MWACDSLGLLRIAEAARATQDALPESKTARYLVLLCGIGLCPVLETLVSFWV